MVLGWEWGGDGTLLFEGQATLDCAAISAPYQGASENHEHDAGVKCQNLKLTHELGSVFLALYHKEPRSHCGLR
jgi:hypothetical protein